VGEAIGGEEGGVRFEPESQEHVFAAMDLMQRSVYYASTDTRMQKVSYQRDSREGMY